MANQTTDLGVAAKIAVLGNLSGGTAVPGKNNVVLSVSGATYGGVTYPATFQLNPNIEDAAGNEITPGTAYVLTAVATSSGATAVYTGTIGASSNSLVGLTFTVAGFVTTPANNGTFICTANNGSTTITLENADAVSETHAATATSQEIVGGNNLTYVVYGFKTLTGNTYQPSGTSSAVATISSSGVITSVKPGQTVVEVSYPTFNNASGVTGAASGNPMYNLPLNKIYAEVNVQVLP